MIFVSAGLTSAANQAWNLLAASPVFMPVARQSCLVVCACTSTPPRGGPPAIAIWSKSGLMLTMHDQPWYVNLD
jgi:hypothetical protein